MISRSFGSTGLRETIGCHLTDGGCGQTITTSTATTVTFDTERYDTDSMHDPCCNPDRITINTAGKYIFHVNISWGSNSSRERYVSIRLNGGVFIVSELAEAPAGAITPNSNQNIYTVWDCAADDYFEVRVFQTSGGNLDILNVDKYSPEFSAILIGT